MIVAAFLAVYVLTFVLLLLYRGLRLRETEKTAQIYLDEYLRALKDNNEYKERILSLKDQVARLEKSLALIGERN